LTRIKKKSQPAMQGRINPGPGNVKDMQVWIASFFYLRIRSIRGWRGE
jgi:hypothetical protein